MKVFKVGICGLAANEQKTLGSIFQLAASHDPQYSLVSAAERASAEIILVDIDDPKAADDWRSFSVHHDKIPHVKVTKGTPPAEGNDFYLRRPLTLKRVLEIHDYVARVAYKYVPGSIGDDPDPITPKPGPVPKPVPITPRSGSALIVDDSSLVRKSMEERLGLFGLEMDFAETGEQGVEFTQKKVYDIIFLDVMLPGIDGYTVCKKIKSHKLSKNTPVIMLTGKGGRFDKLKGTMAGANFWLTKPVEQEQLKEVINKFLPTIQKDSG